jgi:hypothetical protein
MIYFYSKEVSLAQLAMGVDPGTQVQIPTDVNLGSYYLLKKNSLWGSPPPLSFQKKFLVL